MSISWRLRRPEFGGAKQAASWAMLGQVSALVASTANFLLLARVLGPAEYGLLAGTWALVLAFSPIAAVGSDRLIVRDISGGGVAPNQALGSALLTMAIGSVVVVGSLVLLQPILLPQTVPALLLLLAIADVVALGVTSLINAVCFATANAKAGGIATMTVNLTKFLAVVVFAISGGGADPVQWAAIYATLAIVSATGQLVWAFRRFGRPAIHGYHLLTRVREGLPFTGGIVASVVQNDADKTLLVRAGLAEATGHYSVAYRMASIAYLPVLAVLQTTFRRFFAAGAEGGLPATVALGRRLAKPLLAYAVAATIALIVCAPLIPVLVGEEYRDAVPLLMLLAPLVMVKVVQSVVGDMLTGAGHQHARTGCIAIAAGVNVATNLALIPFLGIHGAIIATAVTEVLQATLLLVAVRRKLRRGAPAAPADIEGLPSRVEGSTPI